MAGDEPELVFERLKKILKRHERRLVVVSDTGSSYYLDTPHELGNGKRLFFGAVRRGKRYVSFYLMPVYARPELLEGISPELRKRMHGKSCFNFTKPDEALFKELEALTRAGIEKFQAGGYLR